MNFQPAFDQINAECRRQKRDPTAGEMSWEQVGNTEAVSVTMTWADGVVLSGYAPFAMVDIRASLETEKGKRRATLTLIS
jgi:hypothetical protein